MIMAAWFIFAFACGFFIGIGCLFFLVEEPKSRTTAWKPFTASPPVVAPKETEAMRALPVGARDKAWRRTMTLTEQQEDAFLL